MNDQSTALAIFFFIGAKEAGGLFPIVPVHCLVHVGNVFAVMLARKMLLVLCNSGKESLLAAQQTLKRSTRILCSSSSSAAVRTMMPVLVLKIGP